MPKFRKKPIVVEARQVSVDSIEGVREWCGGQIGVSGQGLFIPTRSVEMYAACGDWVIKGVQGEFYPCRPDIFEATYEPVEGGE